MSDPLTIIHGDALSSLRTLESESVQCCVTSPPYWGLRDYGLEPSIWGPLSRPWGPAQCKHEWSDQPSTRMRWGGAEGASDKQKSNGGSVDPMDELKRGAFCECGAWRGQLGLEPTPELYVSHLVEIFSELKRVLRGDGTLWLNLGDSYAANRGYQVPDSKHVDVGNSKGMKAASFGLKPKDLVGVPWMVAFALRAEGWYLRSDIIWAKPNPMPESVTDRPTKSHEYIFLLTKSERYFYNADAIAEPLDRPEELDRATPAKFGGANKWPEAQKQSRLHSGNEYKRKRDETPRNDGERWNENNGRGFTPQGEPVKRNKRSVWRIATTPYPDAHFATFPTEIPRLCVLAGSKAGDTILDPFSGSGTTAKVAIELGRKAIAIEPKAEYVEMIKKRCRTTIGLPLAI